MKVDLNVDIGEGFPHDEALLEFATSANVCLGAHAGSTQLSIHTMDLCWRKGVRVGAHPGYPDRESMGRKPIADVDPREALKWLRSIADQLAFAHFIKEIRYCKPHGAFYNDTAVPFTDDLNRIRKYNPSRIERNTFDRWILNMPENRPLRALQMTQKTIMGLPETAQEIISRNFIREGFADRRYNSNGTLVPRCEPNAILEDREEIRQQVLDLAPRVDSICLHGDTPNCLEFAELVKKTLIDGGYDVGF